MTPRPRLGAHLLYRCGHSLFVKREHAERHQFTNGRWVARWACAACRYFPERKDERYEQ